MSKEGDPGRENLTNINKRTLAKIGTLVSTGIGITAIVLALTKSEGCAVEGPRIYPSMGCPPNGWTECYKGAAEVKYSWRYKGDSNGQCWEYEYYGSLTCSCGTQEPTPPPKPLIE